MKLASVLLAVGCLLSAASALQPGFDAREVVRQMRSAARPPSGVERPELDDGEFLIDTSFTCIPTPRWQYEPAVAFDGTNFLVVWRDYRSEDYDIYGARVSQAGTVLDPAGIALSTAAGSQEAPCVAFDGTDFLVVWQDRRRGNFDIYGARLSQAGTVLDPAGIAISTADDYQWYPAVAFDGASFLVVWQDYRNGSDPDIYGARVSREGAVLDPSGIAASTAAGDQGAPGVAFDGTDYLVVWQDSRDSLCDIYAARVSQAGAVLDPSGIAVSTAAGDQGAPAVAFDGTDYLVVWQDSRDSLCDIYAARVSQAGAVLDPSGIAVSTAAGDQGIPRVAFDGTNFFVVWQDYRNGVYSDIYGARVSQDGALIDPSGFPVSTAAGWQGSPAVAFDGTDFLASWVDTRIGNNRIYGARVNRDGTVLDTSGIILSTSADDRRVPAVAFDGASFLVVWQDYRNGSDPDIYGARVSREGAVLDPSGIAVSTATGMQYCPVVAFDGTNFFVVWRDFRSGSRADIYGARVSQEGTVLDPSGIAISTVAGNPALAFDGTNFLVVWADGRSGHSDIYGARVSQDGIVLDPSGIAISTAAEVQLYPAVAFGGTGFLVVWTDGRGGIYDVYAARVSQDGAVLDTSGIAVSAVVDDQWHPAVAFDGTDFLVVWEDRRSGYADIYGARVSQDGTVLDTSGIAVSTAVNLEASAAVAFDGSNCLVVWEDRLLDGFWDIRGARVTPAGVVFDSGTAVEQEGNQQYPALARGAGSQTFLVYQGWTGTVGGRAYNTERIWGKLNPCPGIQESPEPQATSPKPGPTVVRGVLSLSRSTSSSTSWLLDIAGRKVMELLPGPNDVRALAPGVYFVMVNDARYVVHARRIIISK